MAVQGLTITTGQDLVLLPGHMGQRKVCYYTGPRSWRKLADPLDTAKNCQLGGECYVHGDRLPALIDTAIRNGRG